MKIRPEGVLGYRDRNSADDQNREQRHLEAGSRKRTGVQRKQAERGKADGVQTIAFPEKQTRQQVQGHHPERPLHRFPEAGQ